MSTATVPAVPEAASRSRVWLGRLGPDALALVAMAAVFVLARLLSVLSSPIESFQDTGTYFEIDFLGGAPRPWPLPLLWKLVPGGDAANVAAQVLLGIAAWLLLAFVVQRGCRIRSVGLGGFALVLLCGLGIQAVEWDMALLSESFSISLLVALIAAAILAVRRLTPARAAALVVVFAWWIFVRPGNFTIVAACIAPLAVGLALSRRREVILWVLVPLLAITAWAGYATSREDTIWVQNSVAVIQDRLLVDPEARAFLYEHDMPRTPLVESQIGVEYIGYEAPLANDAQFRAWVIDHFKPTYLSYLLQHPGYLVGRPATELSYLVGEPAGYTKPAGMVPAALNLVLYPTGYSLQLMLVAVLTLGLASLIRTRAFAQLTIPVLGVIAALGWIVITWHLGGVEFKRIQVGGSMLLHLSAVLVVVASVDALVVERRRRAAA